MAIYHLTAKTGTRGHDSSARSKHDYVAREGEYANREDKLVYAEHGHMPAWAAKDAGAYWEAADMYERKNGRLFKEFEVALPRELDHHQNQTLISRFVRELTTGIDGGNLPYSMAIHEGKGNNPHAHFMISERVNDGYDRSPELWFKRVATGKKKTAAEGGARKTTSLMPAEWFDKARARWAEMTNEALAQAGHDARVDHRSLADQRAEALEKGDLARAAELDRAPQQHLGPRASAFEARTGKKSRRRLHIEERQRAAAHIQRMDRSINHLRGQLHSDVTLLTAERLSEAKKKREAGLRAKEAMTRRIAAERAAKRAGASAVKATTPAAQAPSTKPVGVASRQRQTPAATKNPTKQSVGQSLIARAFGAGKEAMHGMSQWGREAIKSIEEMARLMKKWQRHFEEMRIDEERAKRAAQPRRKASAPATVPVASRPQPAPARADLRPASQPPQTPPAVARPTGAAPAGDIERLRKDVDRAIAGQGVKKSDALTRAAAMGDRESVDRLLNNGAAVLPKSLDAAAKSGRDDVFKKLVGFEGSATDAISLRELANRCDSTEAKQKLDALAAQAKAQGGHVGGLGIDGPSAPGSSGPKTGAGPSGPK